MAIEATLYDGRTALPQPITVEASDGHLTLSHPDGLVEEVGARQLRRLERDAKTLRIGRSDLPGWRLILPAACEPDIAHLLAGEERYGRLVDRIGLVPALAAFAAIAIGVIAIGYAAPQWIAPHVPASWERNLGSAMVGDFGELRCRNPQGQRALEALVERLDPGVTSGPDAIRIAALDVALFNAAALPGGHIVVFESAITETESVDELAGIIAHEIAHVRRRHVTEALIRELGIGALIRLFAGDIGANAQQLVALSYTREHETEADADAIAMLERAGVSPLPTARLFDRLAEEEGEWAGFATEFLSSHPVSSGRARRFAGSFDKAASYRPALNEEQAAALFNVCWKGPAEPAPKG